MNEPMWRRYLRLWGPRVRQDVDDELEFHLEMRREHYRATGMTDAEAREAAARRFGDAARFREECAAIAGRRQRSVDRGEMFDALRQDLRYALRQLRRNPGFAAVVILTLALGIGANLVIFGLVDAVVLHPTPGFAHPERVMTIAGRSLSYPAYLDFRDKSHLVEGVAAFRQRVLSVGPGGTPALATVGLVTGNYFPLLGASLARGRAIQPDDDSPTAPAVAVLSHGYWQRVLGQDPSVIGRVLRINGIPVTVVGIAAREFRGLQLLNPPDLWLPLAAWPQVAPSGFTRLALGLRNWSWLTAFVVLRPDGTAAAAEADLNTVAREIRTTYPDQTSDDFSVTLAPASETSVPSELRGGLVRFSVVLMGVVGLVLLLAAANVANLVLARAATRQREIGLRLAIGAGRGRVARQFLTEAALLCFLAGIVALGLMRLAMAAARNLTFPGGMTIQGLNVAPDGRLLLIAGVAVVLTALLLGLVPVLSGRSSQALAALRETGGGGGRWQSRTRSMLLATQVALSLVLLIGAGLFARSLQQALTLDPGFRAQGLATASVNVGLARYTPEQAADYYARAVTMTTGLPGVESAAWTVSVPLTDDQETESVEVPGYTPSPGESPEVEVNIVTPGYFRTLNIPFVRGEGFDPAAPLGRAHTVVINQAMADRYWKDRDPIGAPLNLIGDTCTVIGVIRNARYHTLTEAPVPLVYLPLAERPVSAGETVMTLFVRGGGDPDALAALIRRNLTDLAPAIPVFDVENFQARIDDLLLPQRVGAGLLSAFGLLSLLVAGVGVYGVVGFVVARRTREAGIRLALGEAPGALVRRMVRDNLRPIVLGLGIGTLLAAWLSRSLTGFLYGVSPADPTTYLFTCVLLFAASLVAAILPARRASRVDPISALRSD